MSTFPACIIQEPEEQYHARSRAAEYLSSHRLADFRRSPYRYYASLTSEEETPDKPEFLIGRAAHCLILERMAAFQERYIVSDGPTNERTGKPYGKDSKAYHDWLSVQPTRNIISTADYAEMLLMQKNVLEHEEIYALLDAGRYGVAEGVVRAEIEGVPCQIRMDWFAPEIGIIDLKTCRDIDFFSKDVRDYGYILQMAFYRAVLREATGGVIAPCHLIAVDKTEFHIAGYGMIPEAELDFAEKINMAAIRRLKECCEKNEWATGYERKMVFTMSNY